MQCSDIQNHARQAPLGRLTCTVIILVFIFLSRIDDIAAHEYWIEPVDFTVNQGSQIVAELKNGENFKGNSLPFLPSQFERFTLTDSDGEKAIEGRLGDLPAVSLFPRQAGVAILLYESGVNTIRYEKFSKFEAFAAKEGIEWILAEHKKQKLPTAHIAEVYFRYAKSLVLVGSGNGTSEEANPAMKDQYQGMPLELVLLDNPYTAGADMPVEISLLFDGEPLPGAQVSIFEKRNGLLERVRTNAAGIVNRKFKPGTYLLNTVHAIRPSKKLVTQTGALWQTLWATTTFVIP